MTESLNYHHLLYFWVVARQGSITRASAELNVAQPTISGQLRALEQALHEKLFVRAGRGLALTDVGRTVYRYADEIFSLGRDLQQALRGHPPARPVRLSVGIVMGLSDLAAYQLLAPAMSLREPVQVVCRRDQPERLLADLAARALDVVLSDTPVSAATHIRAYNHALGGSGVTFYATDALAAAHRRGFPRTLDGAPVLLPTEGTTLRRALQQWFGARGIRPRIVAESDDCALLQSFGQAGVGLVSAPTMARREIRQQHDLRPVGELPGVRQPFYAIALDRKIKHPAVTAMLEAARSKLGS